MKQEDPISCPECGKPLPRTSQHQLCPACLLAQAMASQTRQGAGFDTAPVPEPDEIAGNFPQFEILEYLGRGGMGVVYKARQKSLNRLVAIKILAPERNRDIRFAGRFAAEAELLAKLSHPHIVTIHDFGETGGLYYLVMEFVDGVNLRDLLRDGKMEPKQALAIVPPICDALQYAHEHGIVHRDIKPENILLDKEGRVKIADFGIAALVGAVGDQVGTPPYMAPEQTDASSGIDHRADIYALGVVFYEMLTGERPESDLVAPSRKVRIDVRLDEVVLRALEKKPELRYQQVSEVRTIVETITATPGSVDGGCDDSSSENGKAGGIPVFTLLKSERARLSVQEASDARVRFPVMGEVTLYTDRLVIVSGYHQRSVLLSDIQELGESVMPFWESPGAHRYATVDFDEAGQRRRLVFLAGTSVFRTPGDTCLHAAEWLTAIQRAVKSATGRELAIIHVPTVVPVRTWRSFIWLIMPLAVAIPLVAKLLLDYGLEHGPGSLPVMDAALMGGAFLLIPAVTLFIVFVIRSCSLRGTVNRLPGCAMGSPVVPAGEPGITPGLSKSLFNFTANLPLFVNREGRRHLYWPGVLLFCGTLGFVVGCVNLGIALVLWLLNVTLPHGNIFFSQGEVWVMLLWMASSVIMRLAALNLGSNEVTGADCVQAAKDITERKVIGIFLVMMASAAMASGIAFFAGWLRGVSLPALADDNLRVAAWVALSVAACLFLFRRVLRVGNAPSAPAGSSSSGVGKTMAPAVALIVVGLWTLKPVLGAPWLLIVPPILLLRVIPGLLIVIGGYHMLQRRSYSWAIAAGIISLIPLSHIILLGLPVGIWSLIVLARDDVRSAFGFASPATGISAPQPDRFWRRFAMVTGLVFLIPVVILILSLIAGLAYYAWDEYRSEGMDWQKAGIHQDASGEFRKDFSRSFPLSADGRFSLDHIKGRIEIHGWDGDQVVISAIIHGKTGESVDAVDINIDPEPNRVVVHTEQPSSVTGFPWSWLWFKNSKRNDASADYVIHVPRRARLDDISSHNGSIAIDGVNGNITASTHNGDMQIKDAAGNLKLSTHNGRISADMALLGPAQTVSLDSYNGEVELAMPDNANADISASTANGAIISGFSSLTVGKEFPHGSNLKGKLGNGGAIVKATSHNGGIHIRQSQPSNPESN